MKATLKAREVTEIAEALALYPSHLINHLDDVVEIRRCLDKIEERYSELRNIDATPGRTVSAPTVSTILYGAVAQLTIPKAAENSFPRPAKFSELAGSEVKNKEAAKLNNIDTRPYILISILLAILCLITRLTSPCGT